MSKQMTKSQLLASLCAVVLLVGVVAAYLIFPVGADANIIPNTADAASSKEAVSESSIPRSNSGNRQAEDKSEAGSKSETTTPSPTKEGIDSEVDSLSYIEAFISEFDKLVAANEWDKLEAHLTESIRKAPDLNEFLPVLLGCLSSVEERIGYYPVGRGVQLGMYGRADIEEYKDLLAEALISTESPVLQVSLLSAVAVSQGENSNKSHLRRHLESLLLSRRESGANLRKMEMAKYEEELLSVHLRLSASVLESIEFMESLRSTGLSDIRVRFFWKDCGRLIRSKRYFEGEEVEIVRHLIAHTNESLEKKDGSKKDLKRLVKIWQGFREQQAYDAAVKHADDATDEMIQDAYDQILAKWLAYEE